MYVAIIHNMLWIVGNLGFGPSDAQQINVEGHNDTSRGNNYEKPAATPVVVTGCFPRTLGGNVRGKRSEAVRFQACEGALSRRHT